MEKNSYRFAAKNLNNGYIDRKVSFNIGDTVGEFSQRLTKKLELVICGAGHVSKALCAVAKTLNFCVTVIDEREELVTTERFPLADKVIFGNYIQTLKSLSNKQCFFAVMTPGHQKDLECVKAILDFDFVYLGMIGSNKKVLHAREVLRQESFSEEVVSSIYAPIGLSIGAQTPEEIAISICAELIQIRSRLDCTYFTEDIYNSLLQDKKMYVATIIEKTGSAPRGVGSCLAVFEDSSFVGTIGGGSVENEVIKEALYALKNNAKPYTKDYGLTNSDASKLGMICGGTVKVLFESADLE